MKQRYTSILLSLLAVFCLASPATAEIDARVRFSNVEVGIISDWYRDHGEPSVRGGGKGGKKSKGLPPGIAKNLARGKSLPPGIAKQYLPEGLARLLPQAPRGYERIVVDGKVLLVEVATRLIHDILTDVVLR